MADDFNEAVDGPVTRIVTVDGKTYSQEFPRWSLEDPAPWISEIHGLMVKTLTAKIPKSMSQQDRDRYIWNLEFDKPDPQFLEKPIIQDARRAVKISLAHAGIAGDDAEKIINSMTAQRGIRFVQKLALDVSGLFIPQEPDPASKFKSKQVELEKKVADLTSRLDMLEGLQKESQEQAESESTGL